MTKLFLYALFALLSGVVPAASGYFIEGPKTLQPSQRQFPPSSTRLGSSASDNEKANKPILVVGATGKVGRKVVKQLLDMKLPVRAMVRNKDKAQDLFSESLEAANGKGGSDLQLVVCDLGTADRSSLESAVSGCEAVISVSGAMRFSKLSDFLPWRLLQEDASKWCSDKSHPFYSNYQAQKMLIDLATVYKCSRFVRLTGLSSGFSPFNPVSMIFSSVLSLTSRYHFLCEQYLRNSNIPYVILRPGGLADEDRDVKVTNLQVDSSGSLPPPGRVPRTDVAALAALSVGGNNPLDPNNSYTLAVRAVGDMKPKAQGLKEEGFCSAGECLESIREKPDAIDKSIKSKPYGLAVGVFVYSLMFLGIQISKTVLGFVIGTIARLF